MTGVGRFHPGNSPVRVFGWNVPTDLLSQRRVIPVHEIALGGADRLFVVANEKALDDVVFVGLQLWMRQAGLTPPETALAAAAHLLYRCRYAYYRAPLRGLSDCYRERNSAAEALLGKEWDAWATVIPQRTTGYDPRAFRHGLGDFLSQRAGDEHAPGGTGRIPAGIAVLMDLPEWRDDYGAEIKALLGRIADQIRKWKTGRSRGPKVNEAVAWLADHLAHAKRPPLSAPSPDVVVWAVAFSTRLSWVTHYPLGMKSFADSLDRPLTTDERRLFEWGHILPNLLGFPLLCLPQRYRDLIEPGLKRFFSGEIPMERAKQEINSVLTGHMTLKNDALEQERDYRRRKAANARKDAAQREDRGRRRKRKKPRDD